MARSEFKYCYPFRIRYSEVDGQKIVYNAHYLTFMDVALTEYLFSLGYDYSTEATVTGHDYHTVRNVVDYHAPVRLREDIDVMVRPGRLGNSSVTFVVEIHGKDAEDLRASGEVVWVYTNQETHRSSPLPPEFLAALRAFEGELP